MSKEQNEKLFEAASQGDIEGIKKALEAGAKINAKNIVAMTAITLAARDGQARAMVYLIEQGAKVTHDAIHVASMSADSNDGIVKYLQLTQMKQVKPAVKDFDKEDAKLLRAAHAGRLKALQKAIEAGANINASDLQDTSALRWAARWGHIDVVKALLDAGADINHQSNAKWTVLMEAVMGTYEELVTFLIEQGADVNARTYVNASVLYFAHDIIPFSGNPDAAKRIVRLLEEKGATFEEPPRDPW